MHLYPLESGPKGVHSLPVLQGAQAQHALVRVNRLARSRVAVIAGFDVTVQVRHGVAQDLKVHLHRIEDSFERLGRAHHVSKEGNPLLPVEVVRLADVSGAHQHAVAGYGLVDWEPQLAHGQISNRVPVLVRGLNRSEITTERTTFTSHSYRPANHDVATLVIRA